MISLRTNTSRLTELLAACGPGAALGKPWATAEAEAVRLAGLAEGSDACLAAADNGAGLIRRLEWDSEFFGTPCALIDTLVVAGGITERYEAAKEISGRLMGWAEEGGVRFVAVKLPGPDPAVVQALEDLGFRTADSTAALEGNGFGDLISPKLPAGLVFTDRCEDPASTAAIFKGLFYDGRFHNDASIPKETADRLWESALLNQLQGEAEAVLFLEHEGRPVGAATFKPAVDGAGALFIFGVLEDYRGRGWGRMLLTEALRRSAGLYDRILVETSTYNHPALSLYLSLGFRLTGVKISLHWRR